MSRQVNGLGSKPFQRDGRKGWYSFVRVTDARTGESARKLVSGATKKALADNVRDLVNNAEQGVLVKGGAVTVAAYAERWSTDHLPSRDVTASTRRLYRHALSSYVVPTIGDVRLDKITGRDVERLNAALLDRKLGTASRRLAYNVARAMFATAVRDRVMRHNPADGVARPSDPPSPQATYKPHEVERLVEVVGDARTFAELVPLLVWTGLRVGEALALRWSDVDLDNGIVTVSATLAVDERGREYRQAFPKGKRARMVPLVEPARAALRAARSRVAADKLASGESYVDGGLVFADELGGLIDSRDLRKPYRELVARAGLSGSFHALRRSAATTLTAAHVPLGIVATILGHSSTAVTQAHYTIVDVDMMRSALDAYEAHARAAR